MISSLPKLRSDLDLRPQTTANGTAFVIKDPLSGEFFRLQEAERFIAEQLDGATPLEVVQRRVQEKFRASVGTEALAGFIKTLDRNGLLETDKGERKRRRGQRRLGGSLLYLRFRLFDPERLLSRLINRVRFFFTPQFLFLSASLIFAAVVVTAFNGDEILQNASQLYHISTLPLAVATLFVVITAHEFAHGLTCKHFGGDVREMGFLLLYFQPAFYCNVSDAWLFPEKSKRLWVGFAGPYFELFLWSLATLAWRVTDTETWINHVSLVVMATSGIKTLFNFNPLIKLDGYYLLSDYLDIPNLRKKSFRYVGDFLKRIGGLAGRLPEVSRRERRIYLTYGLTAWVFSFSLLAFVALAVGGFLIEQDHRVAFVAFAGLIVSRVRRKFLRLFPRQNFSVVPPLFAKQVRRKFREVFGGNGKSSRPSTPALNAAELSAEASVARAEFSPPPNREFSMSGLMKKKSVEGAASSPPSNRKSADAGSLPKSSVARAESPRRSKRKIAALRRTALKLAGLAVISALLFLGRLELRVAGPITVLPLHNADVRTQIEGIIEEIYVDEGDRVNKGDLIARLSDRDQRAELQKTQAEVEQTQAKLDLLVAGPTKEQIEVARTAVTKAEDRLKFAQAKLARDQSLFEQQLLSRNDFDITRELESTATNELAGARSSLQVLLKGTRPEEIAAAQAELARLDTQRRYLEEQLQLVNVLSPATGIITTPSRQLKEMVRQMIKKGDVIAKVHELNNVTVQAAISEKEIADVKVGQTVGIKTRSYPDRVFYGTVTAIATTAQGGAASSSSEKAAVSVAPSGAGDKSANAILVTTEIDNAAHLLKPGMTGMAKIYCGERRFIDLVTRRLSRTFRVEFWSWW